MSARINYLNKEEQNKEKERKKKMKEEQNKEKEKKEKKEEQNEKERKKEEQKKEKERNKKKKENLNSEIEFMFKYVDSLIDSCISNLMKKNEQLNSY